MNPLYFLVADRAHYRCEYCHAPESIFNVVLEVMNSLAQLNARRFWIQLGLFP
jgi:hypothetical protein